MLPAIPTLTTKTHTHNQHNNHHHKQTKQHSNPVSAMNWLGSGIAILGTYLYGLATDKAKADAAAAAGGGKPKAA
jgi:sugar/nucleoside kinase (ribokinase family)